MGVSSLVFNYSGYGASSGTFSTAHCEEDAIAAYRELVAGVTRRLFCSGFLLGVELAARWPRVSMCDGLVLCEGFSTFREAGMAMGFPRWLTRVVPDVWDTVHRVRELEMPVLVVHSDKDGLFPVSMAKRVAEACGARGRVDRDQGPVARCADLRADRKFTGSRLPSG